MISRSPVRRERRRGRFAPSPTGLLHVGNAWAALCAHAAARAQGAGFVLRVEDLDPQRCRPGLVEAQLDDLRWLGITWDEGPDVGGPKGPYAQSQRADLYAAALARLAVFPCTCSRKSLRALSESAPSSAASIRTPEGPAWGGRVPHYPGPCIEVSPPPEDASGAALRWRPAAGRVEVACAVYGPVSADLGGRDGAVVLRRRDGAYAYTLAVVVDDAAMGIGQVVRGRDLLEETPLQAALARALGLPAPSYLHVPLVLGPAGHKLSKRAGGLTLRRLRKEGIRPERLVARLAAAMGLVPPFVRALSAQEFVSVFDLKRLRRDDWVIEPDRLVAELTA